MTHPEDPFDRIFSVRIEDCSDEQQPDRANSPLPKEPFRWQPAARKAEGADTGASSRQPERNKIRPVLEKWIAEHDRDERRELIVTFYDTLRIPRFPDLDPKQPRDSEDNKKAL